MLADCCSLELHGVSQAQPSNFSRRRYLKEGARRSVEGILLVSSASRLPLNSPVIQIHGCCCKETSGSSAKGLGMAAWRGRPLARGLSRAFVAGSAPIFVTNFFRR